MQKHKFNRVSLTVLLLSSALYSFAQNTDSSFDSAMRTHDKIYVVMVVCLVILVAVLLYLIRIDMKITRKEKNN